MHSISSPYFFLLAYVFKTYTQLCNHQHEGLSRPLEKSQNIGFSLSAILDPQKHHKSAMSAFDDGPLQWSMA